MAEFWASTGAIWRDMLLAEGLVVHYFSSSYARARFLHDYWKDSQNDECVK